MQITEHIYRFAPENRDYLSPYGVQAFFVVGQGEAIFVDPYDGRDEVIQAQLAQLRRLGDPKLLHQVITHGHWDHFEGAVKVRLLTGAPIGAHALEAPAINDFLKPHTLDNLLADGDILSVGGLHLEVIHTPGHTPGGLCFYLQEDRALLSGDHVMGLGTVVVGPPEGNVTDYLNSLRRLLNYDIETIVSGHGPVVREPQRKINELIQHRLAREQQMLAALERGPRRVEELVAEIYPEIEDRLLPLAKRTTLGHLEKLQGEGRVQAEGSGEDAVFSLK